MSGLAKGCCSAVSPCNHQKRDPHTICETCRASATPADVGEEPVAWQYRWKIDGEWVDWRVADASQKHTSLKSLEERPLYSATALERVTRERDEALAERDALANTLDAGSDPALISRIIMNSIENKVNAESAEAKLAEARKVQEAKDAAYWSMAEQCANLETDLAFLRARLETVEADTRERCAKVEDEAADECDWTDGVIEARSIAATLRNMEPRHD